MGNEKELVGLVGGFNSSNINNLKTDNKDNTQKQEPITDKLALIKEHGFAGFLRLEKKG